MYKPYFDTLQGRALLVLFTWYKQLSQDQSGEQRRALLAGLCAGDEELLRECVKLLYAIQPERQK